MIINTKSEDVRNMETAEKAVPIPRASASNPNTPGKTKKPHPHKKKVAHKMREASRCLMIDINAVIVGKMMEIPNPRRGTNREKPCSVKLARIAHSKANNAATGTALNDPARFRHSDPARRPPVRSMQNRDR